MLGTFAFLTSTTWAAGPTCHSVLCINNGQGKTALEWRETTATNTPSPGRDPKLMRELKLEQVRGGVCPTMNRRRRKMPNRLSPLERQASNTESFPRQGRRHSQRK